MKVFSIVAALQLCCCWHQAVVGSRNSRMGGSVSDFVVQLQQSGELNTDQATYFTQLYPDDDGVLNVDEGPSDLIAQQMKAIKYLDNQEATGQLSAQTRSYLITLLQVAPSDSSQQVPAQANYQGNGIVQLLGRANPSTSIPPPSKTQNYVGIWGYAVGSREYALLCHSDGLHIMDVTEPSKPFRVQFIPMSHVTYWRDVETYQDDQSGKTYAYVSGQATANLFVVDLSSLSGSSPHITDTANCTYVDRGYENYGHTLTVRGYLLFLNSAGAMSRGCQIFDLKADPWDPPLFSNSYNGSGRDCHDSIARFVDVPDMGLRNLLYSADGNSGRYRIVDITDIRKGASPVVLGETPATASRFYAHSVTITEDSNYMYAFDETNTYDILVFNISVPSNITFVRNFGYSEENEQANAKVHNGHIRGNYLYVAYYEAGFRVFDISDPTNPVEVGKYETLLDPDGDGIQQNRIEGRFRGAWNLCLCLPSGNIIVSDTNYGMFVFRLDVSKTPTPKLVPSSFPSKTPSLVSSRKPSIIPGDIPSLSPSISLSILPPVLRPKREPTETPYTPLPTLKTTSVVGNNPMCFAGRSLLEIEHGGLIPMHRLRIGDKVNVGHNRYEPVYAFGHYSPSTQASFLELTSTVSTLVLSADHLIFCHQRGFVPASSIRRGDTLMHGSTIDVSIVVLSIRTVNAQGVFAPFTPSGTIVVNDVLVSSFVSLVNSQDHISILGLDFSFQWLAHSFEFPHRLVCHYLARCPHEEYTDEGFSAWIVGPLKVGRWVLEQEHRLRDGILFVFVLVMGLCHAVETSWLNLSMIVYIILSATVTFSMRSYCKRYVFA